MTDKEIVKALIAHDPRVTAQFFFRDCRPLLTSVVRRVFDTQRVDYDEIISELYVLLMENDAQRLRQFKYESTLYQWLKVTALRHCLRLKTTGRVIDDTAHDALDNSSAETPADQQQARIDVESLLSLMPNRRYAMVVRRLMIDDCQPEELAREMGVRVENLYNIKRRAMLSLCAVAHNDKKHYDER